MLLIFINAFAGTLEEENAALRTAIGAFQEESAALRSQVDDLERANRAKDDQISQLEASLTAHKNMVRLSTEQIEASERLASKYHAMLLDQPKKGAQVERVLMVGAVALLGGLQLHQTLTRPVIIVENR